MKIYVYENIIGNYCSGDYYFIAENKTEANVYANQFAIKHNELVNNNMNYIIEWSEEPKEYDLTPGFISLNRIYLPLKV